MGEAGIAWLKATSNIIYTKQAKKATNTTTVNVLTMRVPVSSKKRYVTRNKTAGPFERDR